MYCPGFMIVDLGSDHFKSSEYFELVERH